jgi:multiple sugar transport system ATP-binding protein
MRIEIKRLHKRLKATSIFVTHDQVEAMTMGDRIGVLNHGRLVQVGTPHEVYNNPRDTFVASFVGSPAINLVRGDVRGGRAVVTPTSFELPLDARHRTGGGSFTFGVRPEDITVAPGAPVEARVHDIENHGIEKILTLRAGDHLVRAAVPARVNVAVEEAVRFGWKAEKVMMFDAASGLNLTQESGSRQSAIGSRATTELEA